MFIITYKHHKLAAFKEEITIKLITISPYLNAMGHPPRSSLALEELFLRALLSLVTLRVDC